MINVAQVYVGVDVSKKHLDICLKPNDKSFRVTNDEHGLHKMMKKLSTYEIEQVVCEASGGYEKKMVQFLTQKQIFVWCVEPKRIKAYIQSEGIKVKTDSVDARMIAKFASEKQCNHPQYVRSASEIILQDYVICRSQIVQIVAAEKTRLEMVTNPNCRTIIRETIRFLEKQIESIEKDMRHVVQNDPALKERVEIAQSMPGVGFITAATLLATLPELGSLGSKEIAALAGVAPYQHQSGKFERRARIKSGRPLPRKALYMAALTAVSCNIIMKEFYQRLKAAGKKSKVGLVAVMRKIIVALNAMLRAKEMWKSA